ncbi:thiol reductase thioredoxin [Candidatus Berkelbacteria bacterium]|nr:thiol reductase thioredoxin [Candidatus Berkelbacteria bacterium]
MSNVKLLDFWAAWCGPCKIMNPILEELEHQYAGKLTVEKINVDAPESQAMVMKYQIMAMPTYFVEKDGQVIEHFVGAQSKKALSDAIEKALV